jgi:hypothetical protein
MVGGMSLLESAMTKFIGNTFPKNHLWSEYETQCIDSIQRQIDTKFSNKKNLLVNLTWFGPQFDQHPGWKAYCQLIKQQETFDNLFLLSTVDPAMINPQQIKKIVVSLGNPKLFKIGNFDTEYHYNFFAPILKDSFKSYTNDELLLTEVRWLYINYNRKPRQHRVQLVKKLQEQQLDQLGIITLGRPDVVYDKDPGNQLYLSVGEDPADYVEFGHWSPGSHPTGHQVDEFGIPHDVLSLHNPTYWRHHFLNIIGATEFNVWDDIFVSESQFKPIIGLRPFLINGNPRTYQWLVDNGFRHFNHYFEGIDFTDPDRVHESICQAVRYLSSLSSEKILDLYQSMLPDLWHNQQRFYEYAMEQQYKINHIFEP